MDKRMTRRSLCTHTISNLSSDNRHDLSARRSYANNRAGIGISCMENYKRGKLQKIEPLATACPTHCNCPVVEHGVQTTFGSRSQHTYPSILAPVMASLAQMRR